MHIYRSTMFSRLQHTYESINRNDIDGVLEDKMKNMYADIIELGILSQL